ncbi:thioesterase II family protein [Methylopila musalis]|uniref:Thioesterase II family protein n=1 Tax=Methylopila musalis TaxID=1134781 RepID=A0ABW3Z399_9HYPH
MTSSSPLWFPHRTLRAAPRWRLFCFAFAGGAASYFRPWGRLVPDDVEIWPVEMPGHGVRIAEPLVDDIGEIARAAAAQIALHADLPMVLFGHSMGSAIGLEVARELEAAGVRPLLFAPSGRPAPQVAPSRQVHLKSREGIRQEMIRLAGTEREIVENEELMDIVLPIVRNDFKLIETNPVSITPPIAAPTLTVCGDSDEDATEEGLRAWGAVTSSDFSVRMFPGGHFYLNEAAADVLAVVCAEAEARLEATGAAARLSA